MTTRPQEETRPAASPDTVIELRGATRRFHKPVDLVAKIARKFGADVREEVVYAVSGVDLTIQRGEVLGLVGESGCGKSTLGRLIAGVLPLSDGQILHEGNDISKLTREERRRYTLAVQMVFQDPFSSLNPRMIVRDIIGEAPVIHGIVPRSELDDHIAKVMSEVHLDPEFTGRYPHEFSGGQRQRIGIARALAVSPEFLVCDESVASLDVSIQAQILNLFMDLREQRNLTYLFISHDLGVVRHISDRAAIMYVGKMVEIAPTETLFSRANHPYTRALIEEIPRFEDRKRRFHGIGGEVPSPLDPPSGCRFHPRCPYAMDICRSVEPQLVEIEKGHMSACHLNN